MMGDEMSVFFWAFSINLRPRKGRSGLYCSGGGFRNLNGSPLYPCLVAGIVWYFTAGQETILGGDAFL